MYRISFYVPITDAESVKEALFNAGAGAWDTYDRVCWQCLGEGQFRPLKGSDPSLGSQNQLEKVKEYKVEMLCHSDKIKAAIAAFKKAHPYEQPAYEVYAVLDF